MPELAFDNFIAPTTVANGLGKFHPALKNGHKILYWTTDTFKSEDAAYEAARGILAQAQRTLNEELGVAQMESLI